MDAKFEISLPLPPAYSPPAQPAASAAPTAPSANLSRFGSTQLWRRMMRGAYRHPQYLSLSLARVIVDCDRADKDLYGSIAYRSRLRGKEIDLAAQVLHTIHQDVKLALIEGSYKRLRTLLHRLPAQLANLPTAAADYQPKELTEADKRPVIYMHFHVDANGVPPSPAQYNQMADQMQRYYNYCQAVLNGAQPSTSDTAVVKNIDEHIKAPSVDRRTRPWYHFKPGKPRYARTKDLNISDNFLSGLRQRLTYIRAQYKETPAQQRNTPIPHPMTETGWTVKPNERRYAHYEHGVDGNQLMNLVDAVGRWLFNDTYRMRFIIVMEVLKEDLAAPAERVVSRLAASYTTTGGTNRVLAGSVASAYKLQSQAWTMQYAKLGPAANASVVKEAEFFTKRLTGVEKVQRAIDEHRQLEDTVRAGKDTITKVQAAQKEEADEQREMELAVVKVMEQGRGEIKGIQKQQQTAQLSEMFLKFMDMGKGLGK